jgi:hypothetical protein
MRAPRRAPKLPLWTGQTLSAADYRAQVEREMSERDIQRTLIGELRDPRLTNGPVLAFAVPNGWHVPGLDTLASARVWRTLCADGALPGAPDLVVGHSGRVMLLELKRSKGGVPLASQEAFQRQASAAGLDYCVVEGLAEARALLRERGVLR